MGVLATQPSYGDNLDDLILDSREARLLEGPFERESREAQERHQHQAGGQHQTRVE